MTLPLSEPDLTLDQTALESTTIDNAESSVARPTSRLIEFPGVTRRTVPPWRKELSERVREVQERRAHEALAEAEAANLQSPEANMPIPQLELLPHAEALDVNPLVVAALKRIERAHQPPGQGLHPSYQATLSVAAGATDTGTTRTEVRQDNAPSRRAVGATIFDDRCDDTHASGVQSTATRNPAAAVATLPASETFPLSVTEAAPERALNLVVVPPTPIVAEVNPSASDATVPEVVTVKPKPKRVISDDASDPALNYLDLVGFTYAQTVDPANRAPVFSRLVAGIMDLLTVCFLSVPFAAVIELRNDNWREPRIAALMAGGTIVVMFIYLTVSTALTGKTLGMRILSLRVIDVRTGLIPTGKQAAGRAFVYILSLATAGTGLLLALARGEGKTVHDRFSRTAVVRD
jgi:uncharacterized RDD family membrane protein YckC